MTVTVQQVKSSQPFGHAVIKVGNGDKVGLVPNSDAKAVAAAAVEEQTRLHVPVQGHVETLKPNRKIEDTAVLHVTPDQAKAMQTTIDQSVKSLHTYDPEFGNCATFVENVLKSGGVKAPSDMTPGGLVEDLKKQNPQ